MKILKDWPKKLLAIIIAFGIWLYVFQTGKTKRVYSVSAEVRNLPTNLIPKENFRRVVEVEVEGEKNLFSNFHPQSIQCILDLSKSKKGLHKYLVRLNPLYVTAGLTYRILNPNVTIHFEKVVRKTVKVIAKTEGELSRGYMLQDIQIEPYEIKIIGPESIVAKIKRIYTKTIDIQGKFISFKTKVNLDNTYSQIKFDKIKSVNVQIKIGAEIRGRIFRNIPVKIFELPRKFRVVNSKLRLKQVEIKGPIALLERLKSKDINAFIIVTNIRTGVDIEVKIHIAPIRGLTVVNYEPKIIKIKLVER